MARPGFERRFRECLGSTELEEKIELFLSRNAEQIVEESHISESKDTGAFDSGEFTLNTYA
jgi:hypothetical protein